jgi:hypothetical protein
MTKKELMKYISAFTMGDGGVYYSGNNCRFMCNQVAVNQDYIEWRAGILEELTEVSVYYTNDKHERRQPILCTLTKTHPIYTKVRERLYIDKYKSVDPHYLKLLDWEMLAILYQDDGSCYKDTRCDATPQAKLNLKRLSYGDQMLLKKALKDRLGLEWNIHRHYHRYFLSLRTKDYDNFLYNVQDFIKPSFYYKLL